jgi:hypothetical protein
LRLDTTRADLGLPILRQALFSNIAFFILPFLKATIRRFPEQSEPSAKHTVLEIIDLTPLLS